MSGKGWLKNGNRPGDFTKAPRCGAKNRRGLACQQPAMTNGRCRLHGGKSTGARTPEGRQRIAQANLKHGYYAKAARQAIFRAGRTGTRNIKLQAVEPNLCFPTLTDR